MSVISKIRVLAGRPAGRPAAVFGVVAGLSALAIWYGTALRAPDPHRPSNEQSPTPSTPAPPEAAAKAETPALSGAPDPIAPAFDVVRVEPSGDSVIAGRASPGATIELLRNGKVHFRGVADQSGLFVLVAPPIPPGSQEIVLQSVAPDGTRTRSRESVTVLIANDRTTPALVALASADKASVVLSNPDNSGAAPEPSPTIEVGGGSQKGAQASAELAQTQLASRLPSKVRIAVIDAEVEGRLFISGEARPGATVQLYLNDSLIAPGVVGADGRLAFAINRGLQSGSYRVRLDEIDPVSGEVKSRAEVPYNMPAQVAVATSAVQPSMTVPPRETDVPGRAADATNVVIPEVNTAIVARGDNLWRISHRIYGAGLRYTVIYGANQHRIRDPNRIYPGQSFVLPPQRAPGPRG